MKILLQSLSIEKYGFLIVIISFVITFIMIPKLIGIMRYEKLMDEPNSRSSHNTKIPILGGIAFFASLIIVLFLIQIYVETTISFYIITALSILFLAGLKDDLIILSAREKIISQLLAITFLLASPEIQIHNFYGFLGFSEAPIWFTIIFSYFAMLSIINAYNLIDGIDGLAAMLGIVIFAFLGLIFYSLQLYFYFLLALVPLGFLSAFLRYNLSKNNKIFMGDAGSMITGFLIGVLVLRFLSLEFDQLKAIHIQPENALLLTLAMLFIMTFDTLRVIMIRMLNKKGLFKPDRNHVHHILIDSGLSHITASIILTTYSLIIALVFFLMNQNMSTLSLFILFSLAIIFNMAALFHLNMQNKIQNNKLKTNHLTELKKFSLKMDIKRLAFNFFRLFF